MYSVRNSDSTSPPTTAMPSGRRASPPAPNDRAMGRLPMSAAKVVIMMGRKRMRQASWIRSARAAPSLRLDVEVDHHDGILLDDADQHDDADKAVHVKLLAEHPQREQRAEAGRGK